MTKRIFSLPTAAFTLLVFSFSASAQGDVTFTGSVTNPPPVEGGDAFSTEVVVGDANASVNDLIGTMRVDDGTSLGRDRLVIGDEDRYIGEVVVTGEGTMVELDSGSTSNPALHVGQGGAGYLTISEQAIVDVSSSSGNIVVGRDAGSTGYVHVNGLLTQLRFGEDLIVGDEGLGELKLTNGAIMQATDFNGSTASIGASDSSGVGLVELEGTRTLWQLPQNLEIGTIGVGTLRIVDHAIADGDSSSSNGITIGPRGHVELSDGGRLLSNDITVDGRLVGDGDVTGTVSISMDGEVGVLAGQTLRFLGSVGNAGVVNVSGLSSARAEVEFLDALTNTDGSPLDGRIAVADGVARFHQPLTNTGTLASTSGVTDFHGDITNHSAGTIAIGGGSNATFYGNTDISAGTFSIAEGSTALFLNDVSLSSSSVTSFQLDSSAQDLGFSAPLQTAGLSSLGGNLQLDLVRSADPEPYVPITVVNAAGGVNGMFSTVSNVTGQPSIGSTEGLAVTYSSTTVDVTRALLGDLNLDQQVNVLGDAFTLVSNLGILSGATWADGDFNGDGAVNVLGDAFPLISNLGKNFGRSASVTSIAVPEPGGLTWWLSMMLLAAARRPARAR